MHLPLELNWNELPRRVVKQVRRLVLLANSVPVHLLPAKHFPKLERGPGRGRL